MEQNPFAFVRIFTSLWDQVSHAPSHVLLFLALIPFGILVKRVPFLPNWLIPWVIISIGTCVYPLVASPKNLPPDNPKPAIILGIFGFLLGIAALGSYVFLGRLAWFRAFEGALVNPFRRGDTQLLKRDGAQIEPPETAP